MKINKNLPLFAALGFAVATISAPHVYAGNYGTNSGLGDPADVAGPGEAATQNIDVQLTVGASIGLDCVDSLNLGEILGFGDTSNSAACSVFTNNMDGYTVQIGAMTPLYHYTTIEGGNASGSNATASQMFNPSATGMTGSTASWAIKNVSNNWDVTNGIVKQSSTKSASTGDNFSVTAGAHLADGVNVDGGRYNGTFTLTASTIDGTP